MTGASFHQIELALGVAANKVKTCSRARDLVLKLANRSLYLIAASLVEVAKLVSQRRTDKHLNRRCLRLWRLQFAKVWTRRIRLHSLTDGLHCARACSFTAALRSY